VVRNTAIVAIPERSLDALLLVMTNYMRANDTVTLSDERFSLGFILWCWKVLRLDTWLGHDFSSAAKTS
jgi:hypothetical protein